MTDWYLNNAKEILNHTESWLKRSLSAQEKLFVLEKISAFDADRYKKLDEKFGNQKIREKVGKVLAKKIRNVGANDSYVGTAHPFDELKDYSKRIARHQFGEKKERIEGGEVNVEELGEIRKSEIWRMNPSLGLHRKYAVFHSFYREDPTDQPFDLMRFHVVNGISLRQGFVNILGELRGLIAIKLYQPIVAGLSVETEREVRILIQEFSGQVIRGNVPYHFRTKAVTRSAYGSFLYNLTPTDRECVFRFHQPIMEFSTLTFLFRSQFETLTFARDRAVGIITFGGGSETTITFAEPHGLVTFEYIRIPDFTTADPVSDAALIRKLRKKIRVSFASTYYIKVPIDSSGATPSGTEFTVIFDNRFSLWYLELLFDKNAGK
jgi:hypothetical protein